MDGDTSSNCVELQMVSGEQMEFKRELQFRATYSTDELQTRQAAHARLDDAVGAVTSYSPTKQLEVDPHNRSLVLVGGRI